MKVVLVGPLPPPINGCSYANAVLLRNATHAEFSCVNTNVGGISGNQGHRFSIRKVLSFLRAYLGLTRLLTVDVIYLTPGQTLYGLLKYAPFMMLAFALRIPYVIHVHGNHLGVQYASLGGWRRHVFHFFISRAAAGIVLSESLRPNFNDLLPAERVYVVENFVGDDLIALPAPTKSSDKIRILYLSNLMREKGITDLLDALQLVTNAAVPFEAIIAGQIEAGLHEEVRERIHQLGAQVRYAGVITGAEKRRALEEANVFVLPTYYVMEGQPISLLEGLAAGNIIVTSAHAGIPDVVDTRNGYVVPVRNAAAIAEVLMTIAKDLPGELTRFSARNAAYAAARFTEKAFARNVLEVLRHVIQQPSSPERVRRA